MRAQPTMSRGNRQMLRIFTPAAEELNINSGQGRPVAHQDLLGTAGDLVPRRGARHLSQTSRSSQPQDDALVVDFQDRHELRRMPTFEAELQGLVRSGTVSILCVWGEMGSKGLFRRRLEAARRFGGLGRRSIIKVDAIDQYNGRTRFDVFVPARWLERLNAVLNTYSRSKRFYWYCRPHVSYLIRVGRGISAGMRNLREYRRQHGAVPATREGNTSPIGVMPLLVATYNINGLKRKKMEVRTFLQDVRCDVLGLQETLIRASDWHLRVPGYRCVASTGNTIHSQRGIALLVADKFSCNPVGRSSPYWVFARILGSTLAKPVIVGTVYIPHVHRREALEKLPLAVASLRAKYPEDPLVLMGDWNSDLHDVQGEVSHWPTPVRVVPNRGHKATRAQGDRTIDHITYAGVPVTPNTVIEAEVLQDWDLSDHWPVTCRIPSMVVGAPLARPGGGTWRCEEEDPDQRSGESSQGCE